MSLMSIENAKRRLPLLLGTYYFFYLECHYCSVEKDFCELGVELSTVRYRPLTLLPQSSESES